MSTGARQTAKGYYKPTVNGEDVTSAVFYTQAEAITAAENVAKHRTAKGDKMKKEIYKCKQCGAKYNAIPGYESSTWQHCICGHIAIKTSENN